MTTVNESWPTGHAPGSFTITGDQTWTVSSAGGTGLYVVGGAAVASGDGSTSIRNFGRCETALATADHEAQCAIGPYTDEGLQVRFGLCVRMDPTALDTHYMLWYEYPSGGDGKFHLFKMPSGTVIATAVSATVAVNDTIKLRAIGSSTVTLTGYQNGTPVITGDDSSSPLSNLRVGIVNEINRFVSADLGVHSFTAADVSAGQTLTATMTSAPLTLAAGPITASVTPAGSATYLQVGGAVWRGSQRGHHRGMR